MDLDTRSRCHFALLNKTYSLFLLRVAHFYRFPTTHATLDTCGSVFPLTNVVFVSCVLLPLKMHIQRCPLAPSTIIGSLKHSQMTQIAYIDFIRIFHTSTQFIAWRTFANSINADCRHTEVDSCIRKMIPILKMFHFLRLLLTFRTFDENSANHLFIEKSIRPESAFKTE